MRRVGLPNAAWLIVAFGCAELPDIEPEMCGNGLVEPERLEDCDSVVDDTLGDDLACGAPESFGECRYVCGGGRKCPVGWSCLEGVCAYSTGEFELWGVGSIGDTPESIGLGDFDGDGIIDIGAKTTARFTIAYGTGAGTFVRGVEVPSAPSGRLAFGDIDEDGRTDMIVPVEAGILMVGGSASRQVRTIPGRQSVFSNKPAHVILDLIPYEEGLRITTVATERSLCALTDDCDLCDSSREIAVPAGLDGRAHIVVPAPRGTVTASRAFVLAFVGGTDALITKIGEAQTTTTGECRTRVPITAGERVPMPGPIRDLALADLDGDGDSDLIAHVEGPAGESQVAAAMWQLSRFGPAQVVPYFERLACSNDACADRRIQLGEPGCGKDAWPLAFGDLDGDEIADVVTPSGAYLTRDQVPLCIAAPSLQTWSEAVIHDFNRDGRRDIAAAIDGLERLDVFLNGGADRVIRVNHATRGPPAHLRVGDFDGDLVDDLAFAERTDLTSDPGHDLVSVMFGTLEGGLGLARVMGRFDLVHDMEVARLAGVDGLLVMGSSIADDRRGVIQFSSLTGNAARFMPSLLSPPLNERLGDRPGIAYHGNIVPGTPFPDLLGAWENGTWVMPSSGPGRYEPADMKLVSLDSCSGRQNPGIDLACVDAVVDRLSPDDLADSIIVTELPQEGCTTQQGRRVLAIFQADADGVAACRLELIEGGATDPAVALLTADLDVSGGQDLAILHSDGVDGGELRLVWDVGQAGLRPETVELPDIGAPLSMAELNADRDAAPELVVLGTSGVAVLDRSEGALTWSKLDDAARSHHSKDRVLAADMDGDGLDDVVVTNGAAFEVYRALSPLD